jgi:hypothetical protein
MARGENPGAWMTMKGPILQMSNKLLGIGRWSLATFPHFHTFVFLSEVKQ